MAKLKLTHNSVKGLTTDKQREVFWDTEFPPGGWFGVAVYKSGKKSYLFSYRNRHNQQRQVTIGSTKTVALADARKQALELLLKVEDGADPAQLENECRKANTVVELCHIWLEQHVNPNLASKTQSDYRRIVEREICPVIGKYKAKDVRRADISSLLGEIYRVREKKTLARHTRSVLHAIFEFGVDEGVLDASPCVSLGRWKKGPPRDRTLLDEEVEALLQALSREGTAISGLFKLLLHTGQRSGEVCGMRWSEVKGDEWHIPAERTKNRKSHIVPLTPAVLRILRRIKATNATIYFDHADLRDFVFVSPGSKSGHISWINKACQRVRLRADLEYFSPHDLRRTVTTGLIRQGVSMNVVQKILNHVGQSVTSRHYDKALQLPERRAALEQWSSKLVGFESAIEEKISA